MRHAKNYLEVQPKTRRRCMRRSWWQAPSIPDLQVFERSLYTRARLKPALGATLAAAFGAAALLALRRR
jgi:hypothetical protein